MHIVNQKSNIQDVCALVDLKANIEDTDRMVTDIRQTYLPI